MVSVYKHLGGTLTHGKAFEVEMATRIAKGITDGETEAIATKRATAIIRDKVLATALIKRSGTKYTTLRKDLANAYALGDDKYPTDLTIALGVLNAYIGHLIEFYEFCECSVPFQIRQYAINVQNAERRTQNAERRGSMQK